MCSQITWRAWESRVATSVGLDQARERAVDKFPEDAGLPVRGPHFEKHGQGGEGSPTGGGRGTGPQSLSDPTAEDPFRFLLVGFGFVSSSSWEREGLMVLKQGQGFSPWSRN